MVNNFSSFLCTHGYLLNCYYKAHFQTNGTLEINLFKKKYTGEKIESEIIYLSDCKIEHGWVFCSVSLLCGVLFKFSTSSV